jgi:hypothetical protein
MGVSGQRRPSSALAPGKGPPGPIVQEAGWAPEPLCPNRLWVGPRAGLDIEAAGKIRLPLPGIERRSPGRPARSQTLY